MANVKCNVKLSVLHIIAKNKFIFFKHDSSREPKPGKEQHGFLMPTRVAKMLLFPLLDLIETNNHILRN